MTLRALPDPTPLTWSIAVHHRLAARGVALSGSAGEPESLREARLETALMALFRDEGDHAAFQALYDFTCVRLALWVNRLLGGQRGGPDPLEILQDAYVNIYRYARNFQDAEPQSFRVWSRTIAGNLVRRARRVERVRSIDAFPEGVDEPADLGVSPAEAALHAEAVRATGRAWMIVLSQYAAAYESLSPRDRLALDLIEVRGLSYVEACARMGVGLSNMKMILFRARRRIRARIASRFDEALSAREAC